MKKSTFGSRLPRGHDFCTTHLLRAHTTVMILLFIQASWLSRAHDDDT